MTTNEQKLKKRFWDKVDKGGDCWNWMGHKEKNGYGRINVTTAFKKNKMKLAHRIAWSLTNNKEVPDGMYICHSCDNKACCNPDHLWVGTAKDNMDDMAWKGRTRIYYGELHHKSKHSDDFVCRMVKEHYQSDRSYRCSARLCGVAPGTFWNWVAKKGVRNVNQQ